MPAPNAKDQGGNFSPQPNGRRNNDQSDYLGYNQPEDSGNNLYKMYIFVGGKSVFEAWLPEEVEMDLTSEWSSPYANTLMNKINDSAKGSAISALFETTLGVSARFQPATIQTWQGSGVADFTVSVMLRSWDENKTQFTQLKNLIGLCLPSLGGAHQFNPPASNSTLSYLKDTDDAIQAFADRNGGSAVVDKISSIINKSNQKITIAFGRYMVIEDVVITNIRKRAPMRLDKDGKPLELDLSISFRPRFTPAAQDVIKWFDDASGAGASSGTSGSGPGAG